MTKRLFVGLASLLFVLASLLIYLTVRVNTGKTGSTQPPTTPVSSTSTPTMASAAIPQPTETKQKINPDNTSKLPELHPTSILALVNEYRLKNGKPEWETSGELCRFAEMRAEYLIQPTYEDFMKNIYPEIKQKRHPGFQSMADNFGYSGGAMSENVAQGAKSDGDVLVLWKNSPTHNSLLLAIEHNGTVYTKACVATRVKYYGSITVLLAGNK